jgi:ABC-type sugar transport system ATPase subunit
MRARVNTVEQLGATAYLYCSVAGQPICIEVRGVIDARVGDEIGLHAAPEHIHLFDAQGVAI